MATKVELNGIKPPNGPLAAAYGKPPNGTAETGADRVDRINRVDRVTLTAEAWAGVGAGVGAGVKAGRVATAATVKVAVHATLGGMIDVKG